MDLITERNISDFFLKSDREFIPNVLDTRFAVNIALTRPIIHIFLAKRRNDDEPKQHKFNTTPCKTIAVTDMFPPPILTVPHITT